MKIFIAGGAGYLGSCTTEYLLESGHEVAVYDSLVSGHLAAIDARAKFYYGDLADAAALDKAMKDFLPDGILDFAAYCNGNESITKPGKYYANNIGGTVKLLEAALHRNISKFVFCGAASIYGVPEKAPIAEGDAKEPLEAAGESMLMVEKMLATYSRTQKMQCISLRCFNAGGATKRFGEDHRPETHLIPMALKVAAKALPLLPVYGTDYPTPDGTCLRDYVHVLDIAEAHLRALESKVSGVFNIGSGIGYSVKEVLSMVHQVTGKDMKVAVWKRRAAESPCLFCDFSAARQAFGWEPKHSCLEEIVRSAWEWYQAHPEGYLNN